MLRPAILAAAICLVSAPASAHPHVWIDVRLEIVFDDAGRFRSVRETWRLDANYTQYDIMPSGDANRDGVLSQAEADDAIARYMGWIGYFDYFTRIRVDGQPARFIEPPAPDVAFADGHFSVAAELVLETPTPVSSASVDVFDQELYYYFDFPPDPAGPPPPARAPGESVVVTPNVTIAPDAVTAAGLPDGCVVARRGADIVDPMSTLMLQRLGLAMPAADPARGYPVRVVITCR